MIDATTFADVSCAPARHEGVWGNGGIATLIFKLGPEWGEYSALTLRLLCRQRNIVYRTGGHVGWGRVVSPMPLLGIKPCRKQW